jgi:preprotein translocase subunit SecE
MAGWEIMSKLRSAVQAVQIFFADVGAEMKKTSWPDRDELMSSTMVIIVSAVLLSAVVGVSDKLLGTVLRLLYAHG